MAKRRRLYIEICNQCRSSLDELLRREMDDDQLILESDCSWKTGRERRQRKKKSKKGNSQYGQDSTEQYNRFLLEEDIDNELLFPEDGQSSENDRRKTASRQKRTVTKLIGDIKKFKRPEESSNNSQQEQSGEFSNLLSNMKRKEENAFYSQAQQGTQVVHESMLGKRRKAGIYGSNRRYVSKRIYLCGSCLTIFSFVEELSLHIRQKHKGEVPDGTIFGMKKQALFKFFHIPVSKPVILPNRKVYLFKCGCGKEYSCSSSLYYHITASHNKIEPPGTIGILNSVRIK